MARRRRQSPFEDLIELAALLPWWLSLALALIAYVFLHNFASSPVPQAANPGEMGGLMTGMVLRGFAMAGQYLIPAACVIGAIGSALARARRKKLFNSIADATNTLETISWREFEQLVGEAFRRRGFTVQETGQGGADGGIDLVLYRNGEKYLVQCKQWRRQLVSVNVVRELFGVMAAEGAKGGFVVISGRFTEDAKAFAKGRKLHLIEGTELNDMIRQSRAERALAAGAVQGRPAMANTRLEPIVTPPAASQASHNAAQPTCPACQAPMLQRTAKRGSNVGKLFWGCSRYPACKGIRPLA